VGIERSVSFVSGDLRVSGRVDRLDDRDGELVVVDYKTSRVPPTDDDARTSLALALYAAAVWKMFRRRTLRVELHHVPTGTMGVHQHTPESLARKVEQARSIARDARRAGLDFADVRMVRPAGPLPRGAGCRAGEVRLGGTGGACPGRRLASARRRMTGRQRTLPLGGLATCHGMEQRISFVTLAVLDLARSRRFYVDGLGWTPELDVPGEVLMFGAGDRLMLSLWDRSAFAQEVGGPVLDGPGIVPMTLSHNVATATEVRHVLALARDVGLGARGAGLGWVQRLLRRPRRVPFGGRLEPGPDWPAGGP
jgi:catechol 2,3-dioxygenase-like lactoylglutathione lyase family enzyme